MLERFRKVYMQIDFPENFLDLCINPNMYKASYVKNININKTYWNYDINKYSIMSYIFTNEIITHYFTQDVLISKILNLPINFKKCKFVLF